MFQHFTASCIFFLAERREDIFKQSRSPHLFKAAHHYDSSASCLERLLSELAALKIESLLCVDAERRERGVGWGGQRRHSSECCSCARKEEKETSMKLGTKRGGKKGKRRHEEVVVTLFVYNV